MPDHPSLSMDLYELTMAQSYFLHKPDTSATFDLFVRDLPDNRSFLLACGLQDCLAYLRDLRFTKKDIAFLKKRGLFSGDFLILQDYQIIQEKYLKVLPNH
jgi:nicotinate phosphoribosyltransferase